MNIKPLGIALIIIGIIMLAYTGFNFKTTEKVVDLGPLEINQEKNHHIQWPPIIGGVLIVGGIVILIGGKKGSS